MSAGCGLAHRHFHHGASTDASQLDGWLMSRLPRRPSGCFSGETEQSTQSRLFEWTTAAECFSVRYGKVNRLLLSATHTHTHTTCSGNSSASKSLFRKNWYDKKRQHILASEIGALEAPVKEWSKVYQFQKLLFCWSNYLSFVHIIKYWDWKNVEDSQRTCSLEWSAEFGKRLTISLFQWVWVSVCGRVDAQMSVAISANWLHWRMNLNCAIAHTHTLATNIWCLQTLPDDTSIIW